MQTPRMHRTGKFTIGKISPPSTMRHIQSPTNLHFWVDNYLLFPKVGYGLVILEGIELTFHASCFASGWDPSSLKKWKKWKKFNWILSKVLSVQPSWRGLVPSKVPFWCNGIFITPRSTFQARLPRGNVRTPNWRTEFVQCTSFGTGENSSQMLHVDPCREFICVPTFPLECCHFSTNVNNPYMEHLGFIDVFLVLVIGHGIPAIKMPFLSS